MKSKLLFFIIVSCITVNAFSQANTSINDYKYVIVPTQFDFLNTPNKYRLNTSLRYLFKENGYLVYMNENEQLPEDLLDNRCLAMYANVKKVKALLSTKVQIELKDCRGNLIFISDIASTKVKEYKEAYNVVIKKAFESIKFLDYSYKPRESETQVVNVTDAKQQDSSEEASEIEKLRRQVEELKAKELKAREEAEKLAEEKVKAESVLAKQKEELEKDLLKVKSIDEGFEILDNKNEIVMILLKTAAPNVYTVKGKDAIVFKQDVKWVYSENTGSSKVEKVLKIKL